MIAFQNIQDTIMRIENHLAEPLDIQKLADEAMQKDIAAVEQIEKILHKEKDEQRK